MKKKIISILLVLILILSASSAAIAASGNCGDRVTWSFDEDTGVLTLDGRGDMSDYEYPSQEWAGQPWKEYMGDITEIVVGSGVTYIGEYAFTACENVTKVTFNSGLKSIGSFAFFNCSALQSVLIPATVRVIGNYAFCRCSSLTALEFERGVATVGDGAFSYCSALSSVSLPNSITVLGSWVFSNDTSLRDAEISCTVTELGDGMFAYCKNLMLVSLPAMTQIGASAFCDCAALSEVTYGGSEQGWGRLTVGEDNAGLSKAVVTCVGTVEDDPSVSEKPDPQPDDPEPVYTEPFDDVNDGDWFSENVKYVYTEEIMNGVSDKLFRPNISATRETIVVAMWRMDGSKTESGTMTFSDVKSGTETEKAIAWATKNGIVDGFSDGTFRPRENVTREQLSKLFYCYAMYAGEPVKLLAELDAFDDAAKISSYAVTPMQWAVARGLINGVSDTSLAPQGTTTRAQLAAILHRFCTAAVG